MKASLVLNPLKYLSSLLIVFYLILALTPSLNAQSRQLRTSASSSEHAVFNQPLQVNEDSDTLSYHTTHNQIIYVWTIPDYYGYGDSHYNVRFTPNFSPVKIIGAIIPIYTEIMVDIPIMRVIVWQSGEYNREFGYPVDPIDSIEVSLGNLVTSSADSIQEITPSDYNYIDLSSLGITFNAPLDFHIGVNFVIEDDSEDIVGVYSDNGLDTNRTRSYMWDGYEELWKNMGDIEFDGEFFNLNFIIYAVVADPTSVSDFEILKPSITPVSVVLSPAFPNPFNSSSTLNYYITPGMPFSASLYSLDGRFLKNLVSGIGMGNGKLEIIASDLTSGVYQVVFNSTNIKRTERIIHLK